MACTLALQLDALISTLAVPLASCVSLGKRELTSLGYKVPLCKMQEVAFEDEMSYQVFNPGPQRSSYCIP